MEILNTVKTWVTGIAQELVALVILFQDLAKEDL